MTYRNEFRIIAGTWRRRRCRFPAGGGIRPTPDRVRETLFNWLRDRIAGARCLDLFAGSGALGLEALSRGADHVVFVERDREAADALKDNLATLGGDAEVVVTEANAYLAGPPEPFDVVFLDPPFASGTLTATCERLAAGWLAADARVYLEYPHPAGGPPLPAGWPLLKSSRAGQVGFALAAADQVS